MHIPDGYLSPQTYVPFYAVIIPYLGFAARKVSKSIRSRQVPLLALGAAFSFVIMMFNVPIPGGTTGHAVGGVIVAILLGPWAASIAVSIALIVQALLFGDGGITAIGANCFNMGVVIPFVGYYVYQLISGNSAISSARRWVAGAVAGYVGLNVAAVIAGIEFGIQPLIAHAQDGHPLYAPYSLSVAVPAMAIEHLILFGLVEALVTALIIKYLQKADPDLLAAYGGAK
ncbi:MAG: cobalt transporter CbiM [Syntrophaceae bacterium]